LPPDPQSLRDAAEARALAALAARSDLASGFFGWIFERTLRGAYHTLRLAKAGPPPSADTPRLIVYSNHASWWDGVTFFVVNRLLFPRQRGFAPIDAEMLAHYPLLGRVGAFGVEQKTRRGAADFLATCRAILSEPNRMIFITAQGRFSDMRERPLRLAPGIAHLADAMPGITLVPLAIEYVHWFEKQPELLLRFGPPIPAAEITTLSRPERVDRLERALSETMDALAGESIARDPSAFDVLIAGRVGVNPLYDAWRRLTALAKGTVFRPGHGEPTQ
jgi:1-acyl-sn-glycerol-3-phosphate acyltransferase